MRSWFLDIGRCIDSPLLLCCCLEMGFVLRFQAARHDLIIRKRSFDLLQAFWVKRMKEQNVCCCIYHVEFDDLFQGLNYLRLQFGFHAKGICNCNCNEVCTPPTSTGIGCHGKFLTYIGTTALWESVVCPKGEFQEWHSRDCLYGECQNCGVDYFAGVSCWGRCFFSCHGKLEETQNKR